jgi:hypothetical protein
VVRRDGRAPRQPERVEGERIYNAVSGDAEDSHSGPPGACDDCRRQIALLREMAAAAAPVATIVAAVDVSAVP